MDSLRNQRIIDSNDLPNKLLRVERTVNIYNKKNKLIREIPIEISPDVIKALIPQRGEDPNYYDGYELNENQITQISQYLLEKPEVNIQKYNYYLVAAGIYNW